MIGDSITEQGICVQGSGTYHQLTNVASAVLGMRVWLNGREVFSDFMGGATKKLPIPDLTLEAGDNLLVIRADHRQGQRQFALDFEPIAGDSLDDVRIDWK